MSCLNKKIYQKYSTDEEMVCDSQIKYSID